MSRQEMLLAALAGDDSIDVNRVDPRTRREIMLAYLCGCDGIDEASLPEPRTREEIYLHDICCNGGLSGGGSGSVHEKEVNFYDYDGTCLYAYTVEEAQALTELPSLPERPGLICQGWNWSLEDIKARNRTANVGATYITDDGTTRIYIHLEDGRTSPMLGVYLNGTVYVDWGDGTTPTTLTGKNTVVYTPNHNYAEPGDYVIRLTVDGEIEIFGYGGDSSAYILRHSKNSSKINKVYHNSVRKIEIGNCVTIIGNSAFSNCYSLTSISIPNSVASIDRNAFYN